MGGQQPGDSRVYKWSFTLSYTRGKAKPTFKHFDSFLAGFKIPFGM